MDLYNQKASFEVVIGNGFLSSHDIQNLEVGDFVSVNRLLNEPYPIYYNQTFIYSCEIVVLNEHYGVRISNINQSNFLSTKVQTFQSNDFLPTRIIFDKIHLSLKEISNVSKGTIIYLGKEYNKQEKAKLFLAGFELGEGEIVIVKDRIGLLMTQVYKPIQETASARKSGYVIKSNDLTGIKIFDFKRPDRLSGENIKKLGKIHNDIIKIFNKTFDDNSQFQLLSIKSALFKEIIKEISNNKNFLLLKYHFKTDVKDNEKKDSNIAYIIQEENSRNPLSENYIKMFSRLYSEWQKNDSMNFLISYKNESFFHTIHKRKNIEEIILSPIEDGWKNTFDIHLQFRAKTARVEKAKIVPDEDLVFVVKIGRLNSADEFVIVYPFHTLEPIIHLL